MRLEIVEKLKKYLESHSINKEDEVVYLMVELRKLLDRQRESGEEGEFQLVRFYSDWVVHTDKKHITSAMKNVLHEIENRLDPHPKEDDVSFLLLPEFRKEMSDLFEASGFETSLCKDQDKWKEFVISLTQVLADQPMIDPTTNIKEFRYHTRDKNHLLLAIDFKDGKGGITMIVAENTL